MWKITKVEIFDDDKSRHFACTQKYINTIMIRNIKIRREENAKTSLPYELIKNNQE